MCTDYEHNSEGLDNIPPWRCKRLVSLWEILMWLDGDYLFRLASLLRGTATLHGPESKLKEIVLTDQDRTDVRNRLTEWSDVLEKLGARGPLATIRRWRKGVDDPAFTWADLRSASKELHSRVEDELAETVLWVIPAERALQFKNRSPFGDKVASHFPPATEDLGDAAYCLLLGRGTATVFHLMRVMEVGLRALAASLNDPTLDPKRNPSWETILGRGDRELQEPLSKRSLEWQTDEGFFSTAHANLRAVKDAWRNPTMHIERRYDPEEAEDVWNAVKAFMRHLSKKLSI